MVLKVWKGDEDAAVATYVFEDFSDVYAFCASLHSGKLARNMDARPDEIGATWGMDASSIPLGHILPKDLMSDGSISGYYYFVAPPTILSGSAYYVISVHQPEMGALLIWATRR